MEGDPALVVGLVDAGSVFHQESHHVDVVVYARLKERGERESVRLLHLIDCHVLSELLGNFGSRSVPDMPAHSGGA